MTLGDEFIALLKSLTPEQMSVARSLLSGSTTPPPPPPPALAVAAPPPPKKAAAAKKPTIPAPAASTPVTGVPTADSYRVLSSDIDHTTCVARIVAEEDKSWKPIIYREGQCRGAVAPGSDLCSRCSKRETKYTEAPKASAPWNGRITEEPLPWMHMLGTEWAAQKKPRYQPTGSAPAPAPTPTPAPAPASNSASNSASSNSAASAPVSVPEPPAKMPQRKKAVPVEVKVAEVEAPVPEVSGELQMIDGDLYMIRNGNVFSYDMMTEIVGGFMGRVTADGAHIDTEADELAAAESDTE